MKAKKKYRIGCNNYRFVWKSAEWSLGSERYGESAHVEREIHIGKTATDKMDTLIHEIIHCIDAEHKLELKEQAVDILARHLVSFCRDNGVDLREQLEP